MLSTALFSVMMNFGDNMKTETFQVRNNNINTRHITVEEYLSSNNTFYCFLL